MAPQQKRTSGYKPSEKVLNQILLMLEYPSMKKSRRQENSYKEKQTTFELDDIGDKTIDPPNIVSEG
ncbi:hypothetical protein KY290_033895 [Solanum tuberosum]|uniref:Uncharacterized protein n=1 Tax=Solanum tuberosum TaxID=4113 RepID=A0ABQ7U3J8_SOLTU|nr:hypothetical protein KY290_033895 [Solanum tuberosum]